VAVKITSATSRPLPLTTRNSKQKLLVKERPKKLLYLPQQRAILTTMMMMIPSLAKRKKAREEKSKDNKKIIVSRDKAKKVEKASRQPQQKKMSLQRPYPTKKRKQSLMMTMIQPRQRPSAIRFKSFIVSNADYRLNTVSGRDENSI